MRIEPARDWSNRFLPETLEPVLPPGAFDVIDKRLVCVDVDDFVWIKRGTVIAYHGDLRFHLEPVVQAERPGLTHGPIRSALKREVVPIAEARGRGRLYLSSEGRYNGVVRLRGDEIYVASSNLLVFEPSLEHEILTLGGVGALAGGLLAVRLRGTGRAAISIHGDPLTLRVTEANPISTDPTATVAWSRGLWPELKTDLDAGSFVAHGGGESVQMRFRGDGYVVVQPKSRSDAVRAGVVNALTSRVSELFA
jgi:uncharacterized protein (AIM24 family)